MLRRVLFVFAVAAYVGLTGAAEAVVLFEEDFESVNLGPIVTFGTPEDGGAELLSREAWSNTAPNGFTVDASQVPGQPGLDGVTEFRGWTFVDKDWWTDTAGDQNRSAWSRGYNIVAVADNDEFDDFSIIDGEGDGRGPTFDGCSAVGSCYDTTLTTPAISLAGVNAGEARVVFDSSYRPEHEQDVALEVSYDGGPFVPIFTWLSTNSEGQEPFFVQYDTDGDADTDPFPEFAADGVRPEGGFFIDLGPDNTPGTDDDVTAGSIGNFTRIVGGELDGTIVADNTQVNQVIDVGLDNPAGAGTVQVRWNMFDSGNDWWWAVDNIQVYTGEPAPRDPALTAVVDPTTGNVTIMNGTSSAVDLTGYQILSDAGAFNSDVAQFLSESDSDWVRLTADGDGSDLSEGHLNSFTLASGESIDLGDGAWGAYFDEDVSFSYLVDGDPNNPILGLVEFTDSAFDFLDLNFDGTVDIQDYVEWLTITDTADLSDLTVAQAYRKGDLDGDLRLGVGDFVVFQSTFNSLFGAGAFAEAVAGLGVPEPGAAALALITIATMGARSRRN